jgi:hypothetical protein
MLAEKDLWNSLPNDLRSSLETILDRYQRHLMRLEAEVAELRNSLPRLQARLNRRSQSTLRLPSATRPRKGERAAASVLSGSEFEEEGNAYGLQLCESLRERVR